MDSYAVDSASTYAGEVDSLILLVGALVGFWFLVTIGMFFWLIFRFRAREGVKSLYITGTEKHLKRWINWPHYLIIVCDLVILVAAIAVWVHVKQMRPAEYRSEDGATHEVRDVRIIGQQWAWTFVHPGPDGDLDSGDDITTVDELHVEIGHIYHYQLESRDVLHDFSVPVFRLKQDAIPGRRILGWFEPIWPEGYSRSEPLVRDIQCAEMCGVGHGAMAARLFLETPEQHRAWQRERTRALAAVE